MALKKVNASQGQTSSNTDPPWDKLFIEIMHLILKLLDLESYIRCTSVCMPWKEATAGCRLSLLPWLLLPHNPHFPTREIYSPTEDKTYKLELEAAVGGWCCGSHDGWLVMAFKDGRSSLLNPFTKAQIQLPSQRTVSTGMTNICSAQARGHRALNSGRGVTFLVKAVLSSAPTAYNCVVAGLFGYQTFAICRPGDQKWTIVDSGQPVRRNLGNCCCDLLIHNGLCYTLNKKRELMVFDLGPCPKAVKVNVAPLRRLQGTISNIYLVESCGDMLMVVRLKTFFQNLGFFSEMQKNRVFKFNAEQSCWDYIENLGNHLIFAGNSSSHSVMANGFPDFRGIYFANDDQHACWHMKPKKPDNTAPIDLEKMHPSIWITPNYW